MAYQKDIYIWHTKRTSTYGIAKGHLHMAHQKGIYKWHTKKDIYIWHTKKTSTYGIPKRHLHMAQQKDIYIWHSKRASTYDILKGIYIWHTKRASTYDMDNIPTTFSYQTQNSLIVLQAFKSNHFCHQISSVNAKLALLVNAQQKPDISRKIQYSPRQVEYLVVWYLSISNIPSSLHPVQFDQ